MPYNLPTLRQEVDYELRYIPRIYADALEGRVGDLVVFFLLTHQYETSSLA